MTPANHTLRLLDEGEWLLLLLPNLHAGHRRLNLAFLAAENGQLLIELVLLDVQFDDFAHHLRLHRPPEKLLRLSLLCSRAK